MDILCPSWHPWEELPETIMSDHQMNVTVVKAARAYRFTLQWLISRADDWLMWRQLSSADNSGIINLVQWWGCRECRNGMGACVCVCGAFWWSEGSTSLFTRCWWGFIKEEEALSASLSQTHNTRWLSPSRVTLTCTDRFCWGEVSHFISLRIRTRCPACHSTIIPSFSHLPHRCFIHLVFSCFSPHLTNSPLLTFLIH